MKNNSTKQAISQRQSRRIRGGCKCGARKATSGSRRCRNIHTDDPVGKPDLAIYSQIEKMAGGNPPSWDSPDIVTNDWRPFRLRNEANVKIRNLSQTVPAINAIIHYSTSPFGIGTSQQLRLSKSVNIAPGSEIELVFPLDQETLKGDPRVGVHILIEHPHDPVMINNKGSQVHDGGYTSEDGRNFTIQIPVFNKSNFPRQIFYSIMPTDIVASLSAGSHSFLPLEQKILSLDIQVPGQLSGTAGNYLSRAVTVVGRLSGGELIGGVTRLIRVDN